MRTSQLADTLHGSSYCKAAYATMCLYTEAQSMFAFDCLTTPAGNKGFAYAWLAMSLLEICGASHGYTWPLNFKQRCAILQLWIGALFSISGSILSWRSGPACMI